MSFTQRSSIIWLEYWDSRPELGNSFSDLPRLVLRLLFFFYEVEPFFSNWKIRTEFYEWREENSLWDISTWFSHTNTKSFQIIFNRRKLGRINEFMLIFDESMIKLNFFFFFINPGVGSSYLHTNAIFYVCRYGLFLYMNIKIIV